ncbi:MAG: imidazole glycerol phosphate synthase subunit HisH [Paraprevotella sp.]|nr:imidazole glycerol phosphate synthase subunit HisH [Paraprevotella sp.]
MKVAIVKYNAGNIRSVVNALNRLGVCPSVTDRPEELLSADRVLFPGQGEAFTTMQYLKEHRLDSLICSLRQPVLGICIGQQLMCRHSEEGDTECLGIFDTDVIRFRPTRHEEKVPHMGWNRLRNMENDLFHGCEEGVFAYFVHSYYVPVNPCTAAVCDYIEPFSAALHKDNFYATQFHPEKSGDTGERILQNFLDLKV